MLLLRSTVGGVLFLSLLAVGPASAETWAVVHARILPSPGAAAVEDGTLVVRDGTIAAFGPARAVKVPRGARRVDGTGATLLAGFWNVHVHFTDPRFTQAATRPAAELSKACRDMLTSRGFTTVIDLGSLPDNTGALQRRQPTLDCPRILSVGLSSFPVDGVPIYVKQELGEEEASKLPQPRSPDEAVAVVQQSVRMGARAIKIFAGTWLGGRKTAEMKLDVVRGATDAAHRAGLLVFAHPQSDEGLRVSIEGGVDVLAHTVPGGSAWPPELVQRLVDRKMSLAPTLSLWRVEMERSKLSQDVRDAFIAEGIGQLRAFVASKGDVLFGTDVGYIPEAGANEEVARMAEAGMDGPAILRSLGEAPAKKLGDASRGILQPGGAADLVLVDGDPRTDALALTRVRQTWVAGRSVFAR
jgi:imidazolonepropionase-like amidohydrolase